MQYPEHTIESYKAAALMGAGIIECDVTFTKDLELICTCPFAPFGCF
jgi:glycerophosphoryl diester phosphodiesterase